jgi:hypothetical protein
VPEAGKIGHPILAGVSFVLAGRQVFFVMTQLKLWGIGYNQFVEKGVGTGIDERDANIMRKYSGGKFSAAFMLQ